jgi:hypothetical protein
MHKLLETFMRRNKERNPKKNIIETMHHPEDLEFIFNSRQLEKYLKEKKDSKEKHHSKYLPLPGIKPYFLDYAIHVITLNTLNNFTMFSQEEVRRI